MKYLFFILLIPGILMADKDLEELQSLSDNTPDIDQLIKKYAGSKKLKASLEALKNKNKDGSIYQSGDTKEYLTVILTRDSKEDDMSGGAEEYSINKETGEIKMNWHEHPMKIPKAELKEIKELKELKPAKD